MAFDATSGRRRHLFLQMVAAQAVSRKRGFIEESILELAARPQISELKIVAYSAGGVLTVVSVSDIEDVVLLSRSKESAPPSSVSA